MKTSVDYYIKVWVRIPINNQSAYYRIKELFQKSFERSIDNNSDIDLHPEDLRFGYGFTSEDIGISNYIPDTEEYLGPRTNEARPTIELMKDGEVVWNDVEGDIEDDVLPL